MDRQDARREDGTTVLDKTEVVSSDGGDGSKKGAWSEFSLASVIASALASVTSVLLMSRIGIGGSLIGVGVAAGASALASQIYKGVLSTSAEKLKNAAEQQAGEGGAPWAAPSGTKRADDGKDDADATRLMPRPATISDKTGPHAQAASGTPIAPEAIRNAAAERQSRVMRRRITVVCIVAALAAVALVAIIISVATKGTGLGPTYSAPAQQPAAEQQSSTAAGQSGSQEQAKPVEQDSSKPEEKKDEASTSGKDSSSSSDSAGTSDSGAASGSTGTTTSDSGSGTSSGGSGSTSAKSDGSDSSSSSNGSSASSSADGKKDSSSSGSNSGSTSKSSSSATNSSTSTTTSSTSN